MASETQIANLAITKLGGKRILALTDDTVEGRCMNALYPMVRDAELRRNHWKFAIKRTTLSALADAPVWGFSYEYKLPNDYLALVQVNDFYVAPLTKDRGPWSVEGGSVLTDLTAPLKFRYTYRVTTAGLFDALFNEALACKLALEGCEEITQSNTKKEALFKEYRLAISEASRADAIENPPDQYPDGTWMTSREGRGDGTMRSAADVSYFASGMQIE